jgi:hypothetical protein
VDRKSLPEKGEWEEGLTNLDKLDSRQLCVRSKRDFDFINSFGIAERILDSLLPGMEPSLLFVIQR